MHAMRESERVTDDINAINRTNNPSERGNRRLNEKFGLSSGSPSMTALATGLQEEAEYYRLQILRKVKGTHGVAQLHKAATKYKIPQSYIDFSFEMEVSDEEI